MAKLSSKESVAYYLSRYQTAKEELEDIGWRIDKAREEKMYIKGLCYENGFAPGGSTHKDLSDCLVKIDKLICQYIKAKNRELEIMRQIKSTIGKVEHRRARRVLMLIYIDGFSYEEIADKIHCGLDSVYRWRRIGVEEIIKNNSES